MLRWACLPLLMFTFSTQAQSAAIPAAAPALTVASLELPGEADGWREQRNEILALLQELRPDVITVQQVMQSSGQINAACWLANRLRYSCEFVTPDPPSLALRLGNAILTRHEVVEDGITLLHPPGAFSAAGMVRLRLEAGIVNVYVVRLRPEEGGAAARQHQTSDLMSWIAATADGMPSLITGDFAAPTEELVRQLPGFQPARKNPSARQRESSSPVAAGHGLDVLYQVRQFADISQQALRLGTAEANGGRRLGMMATVRFAGPLPSPGTDAPQP